jgi:hypothetical protein
MFFAKIQKLTPQGLFARNAAERSFSLGKSEVEPSAQISPSVLSVDSCEAYPGTP